jgi:hypothetical protein
MSIKGWTVLGLVVLVTLLVIASIAPAKADHGNVCNPSPNHPCPVDDGLEPPVDPPIVPVPPGFEVDDWDVFIVDLKVNYEDWSFSARAYTDTSYWHFEAQRRLLPWLTVGSRYTYNDGVGEIRPKAIVDLYDYGPFYVKPRLEYRQNVHSDPSDVTNFVDYADYTDRETYAPYLDHARLGVRLGYECDLPKYPYTVWAWHEPRWAFLGDVDEFDFIGSRSEFGMNRDYEKFSFGPFVRVDLDDEYQEPFFMAGLKVSYDLS